MLYGCTCFGSTYTKIGTIQRRLAWPLRKSWGTIFSMGGGRKGTIWGENREEKGRCKTPQKPPKLCKTVQKRHLNSVDEPK